MFTKDKNSQQMVHILETTLRNKKKRQQLIDINITHQGMKEGL